MRSAALLIFGVGLMACRSHVELKVPTITAPAPERVEAYERLRLPPNNKRLFSLSFAETDGFSLANGAIIFHTEDLLAVVPKDSATAFWVERERRAARSSVALLVGGLLLTGWSLSGAQIPGSLGDDVQWSVTALSASLVLLFASSQAQGYARLSKSLALQSYNFSLRSQLGLCQRDGVVFDCSSSAQ